MSASFSQPLTPESLSSHASPGLPPFYYYSEEIFELERRSLWQKAWQMVGRASDLPAPGDYLTCTLGDQPMVIVRNDAGDLRIFHNACPHRGAKMMEGQGHCNRIRCPYHGWNFDREGRLRGLPRAEHFPGLSKSEVNLVAGRVETWGGFIFASAEPEGEDLKSHLAEFPAFLEQYEQPWEDLEEIDRWFYEEPANWKFPIENYLECYHLPVVHARSLRCFDPLQIQYAPAGRHYQISVPFVDEAIVENHPAFSGKRRGFSYQGFVFPNWMVNTAKDKVSVFRLTPLTPTTTRFEVILYQTPAQKALYPYDREAFRPEFDHMLNEDFGAVRSLQQGVRSRGYKVTQYAETLEYGITHFHRSLAEFYSL